MKLKLTTLFSIFILLTSNLFAQKKANLEGIEIGNVAPEIELPTLDGENFKLSQLKGKLVLVNFWASWCAPCRKKSPDLIKIYENFRYSDFKSGEKEFVIVYVSLDKNETAWKNSIEKDNIGGFLNVGDMKGWKCKAAETYNVKKIPTSLLLDGEGKIIAINLSSRDLQKKLKRLKQGGWFQF